MNDDHGGTHGSHDWDDRAIDAALHELHGSRPPDLSARVLLALQQQRHGDLPVLRRVQKPRLSAWLAAAALLLAAVAIGFSVAGGPLRVEPAVAAAVELTVVDGVFECVEITPAGRRATEVGPGAPFVFAARAGNRLRCAIASAGHLGPFGRIVALPQTELEVRSMEFSVKNGVVAASALTLSVVAGVVTWHSLARSESAAAGEVVRMEAPAEGAATLAVENQRLRDRIAELERRNEALAAQAVRSEATPAARPPEPAAAAPAEAVAVAALFHDDRFALLDGLDWATIGTVTNEMAPLLLQLLDEMEKTGEVPTELAIKIQELNSKLVAQVPEMLKAGMPGFGPNGTYTHPIVVGNTLGAALQAAGQPLDGAQQQKIAGLVRAFGAENQAIVDQGREFDLEHMLAETEMKDRFYKEVGSLLTPEQFAKVYPDGAAGYDGISLFGTGLMTRPYTEAVDAKDAGDFARITSNKLGEQLGLDESTATKVRAVIERVAASSPEVWQDKAGAVETRLRMLKSGRTPAALRQQIAMMREIQRQVPLSAEQKKKLASLKRIYVPLPR